MISLIILGLEVQIQSANIQCNQALIYCDKLAILPLIPTQQGILW